MKLLCVADVHLGRVPARLHDDLVDRAAELGPAAAWRRAVDLALRERVTAVLLAGDLVNSGNDFFEAFAHLRDGAKRLAAAGVQVVAVAGNHDQEVLPRLAQAVPEVRVLGAGGRWEALDLAHPSGAGAVRLLGWSYPSRWVHDSPLAPHVARPAPAASEPLATIGLLHADLDQTGSRYAPVRSAELAAADVNAWLLGHVHLPSVAEPGAGPYAGGYLGSLTAHDPTEAGARGAWLLTVGNGGELSFAHVPLAPLRWERIEVDVSPLEAPEDLQLLLLSSLEALSARLEAEGADPVAVGCRLVLVGRTPYRQQIAAMLAADPPEARLQRLGGTDFFVDRVSLRALPAVDLSELAAKDDPVGLLAARVLALQQPGTELRERLVTAATARLEGLAQRNDYAGATAAELSEPEVASLLAEAALNALDALLAQGAEGAVGGGVT